MSLVIDVHTHPTLKAWERAYDSLGLERVDGRPVQERVPCPEWKAADAVTVMDRYHVQAQMLSNPIGCRLLRGPAGRDLARAMNEEMAAIVARYPARFGVFCVLPLDDLQAAADELAYALDTLGVDGVCLPSNVDGVYLGDQHFTDLLGEFDRRRVTVFTHPVAPAFYGEINLPFGPSVMEYMFDTTRMLTSLVYGDLRQRYPHFNLIAPHAGGAMPYIAERLGTTATTIGVGHGRKKTREEVIEGLKSFHFDLTSSTAPTAVASLMQLTTPDRIMMGSDVPIRPERFIPTALSEIAASPFFDQAARERILSGTALGLFSRLAERLRKEGQGALPPGPPLTGIHLRTRLEG